MKYLTFKLKLILILVVTILFLSSTLIFIAVTKSSSRMKNAHFDQLRAITETESSHIISYFQGLKKLITYHAKTSSVKNALEDMSISFEDLKMEKVNVSKIRYKLNNFYKEHFNLNNIDFPSTVQGVYAQYLYLVQGNKRPENRYDTLYEIMYGTYNKDFATLIKNFNIRNLYLINKKGFIVYSVLKEPDFGTNLIFGPFKNTGLAKAFKEINKNNSKEISFSNFNFYIPAGNIMLAFLGTPVFVGKQYIGALVFQIKIDAINKILSFDGNYKKAGLGKTGEVFMVDKNFRMLNNSRFINEIKNKAVIKNRTTIGILKIKNSSTISALQGKSGVHIITSYMGKKVLSSYKALSIFGEPFAIVAEINEKEAFADVFNMSKFIIITSISLTLLAMFLSLWVLRGIFTKKLNEVALMVKDISNVLNERMAVIESIREGLIAIDAQKRVTIINYAAALMLKHIPPDKVLGKNITELFDATEMIEVLETKEPMYDAEITINNMEMVANIVPITDKGKVIGAVSSFRKKDELYHLAKELSSVQKYSEMLRAQTHEFSNTLHTIAGLIQTEAYKEALELITKEAKTHEGFIKMLVNIVDDPLISAIIIGKYNYANELQIQFKLDKDSSMKDIPENIDRGKIITIIGNLLDNAFESVMKNKDKPKIVSLFMTDYGHDLIFEIEDSGSGISQEIADKIFQKGISSKKEKGSGIGLFLVAKKIKELNGEIDIDVSEMGGASFTVIIPKQRKK